MKYIKRFEQERISMSDVSAYTVYKIAKYKVGDYIKLIEDESLPVHLFAKILTYFCNPGSVTYNLETIYKISGNLSKLWIDEDDIERKLTPDEIEEFESLKNARKYNL